MTEIKVKSRILNKNDQIAESIRAKLHDRSIRCINMIGSPGSGKTSLLEALFQNIGDKDKCAVIEGDIKTDNDMKRIMAAGVIAEQIETKGACHLNAEQIEQALSRLPLSKIKLMIIENVGNLICPVSFDLGENCRIIVISITEGEDKPLKYPAAFISADAMVITKSDLAPYVDANPHELSANALSINPGLRIFETSAKTGEGIEHFSHFLLNADMMRKK